MQLKPINWVTDHLEHTDIYLADIMGITLSVMPDKDGTFTASLTGVPRQRPEFAKRFKTPEEAKAYAVNTMLQREIAKYFVLG